MYKIAICDSDNYNCSKIEEILYQYQKEFHIFAEVDIFYSSESFIKYLDKNNAVYDIIFLDTALDKIDGIKAGKYIREKYMVDITTIVYLSSQLSQAMYLFEIMPISLIMKPIDKAKVYKVMHLAISFIDKNKLKLFSFRVAGITYKVPIAEIIYFESKNKIVNIYRKMK